jgi:1-phosphofructokinase family hexose kinase
MIITVTPDPVLDSILLIDSWTPGIPMKAVDHRLSVGGKGLDASVALSHLGVESTGLCFLAGRIGRELEELVRERYGFPAIPVWVAGETRMAHIVTEIQNKTHSHIFTGGIVTTPQDEQALLAKVDESLPGAGYLITGGILPESAAPDLHARIIERARAAGTPALIDSFGIAMLAALPARPEIVKLNEREFCTTFQQTCASWEQLIEAARRVRSDREIGNLVITCGPKGMLAFTGQGNFHARPPQLAAVNAAGAGDAASAALAWQLSRGAGWSEALRWAAAVSAAVVLTPGTADCRMEDIERLLPQIEISEVR